MQNKGAIRLFAIALALVSLYQLSFTWVTYRVEKKARELSNGDPNKELAYLDSIKSDTVYNFFWIRQFTYKDCLNRKLNLGLDLQGGMNVTLEVSIVDVIRAMANDSKDSTFVKAVALAQQRQKTSQTDFVTLFGDAFKEVDPNASLAAIFATLDNRDILNINNTNEEVLKVIRAETQDAMDRAFNVLSSRIDKFGVAQPNIQKIGTSGSRILVELPGVREPERVRNYLQGTANLEFWETYENKEIYQFIKSANDKIRDINNAATTNAAREDSSLLTMNDSITGDSAVSDTTKQESLLTDADSSAKESLLKDSTNAQAQSLETFKKENPLFGLLRPITTSDNQLAQGAAVGYSHYRDTAQINKYLRDPRVKAIFPRDLRLLWERYPIKDRDNTESIFQLVALKATRDGKAALGGEVITNARSEFGQNQAEAVVSMTMNSDGANVWAKLTKENIGRQIAVVLDDYVYSFPVVRSEIKGGSSEISGNFSIAEAKDLANILKAGKLPAPARIIEEAVVGPSLGREAIQASLISFVLAFILVMIYMVLYYNRAGIVASIALVANLFFLFGVLASLGAALTLPGLAGIVMTMGMAVDANVLIFERIREELRHGKGLSLSIADGFKHAYSAIIDSNVTTILTAIVLFIFGHGPIRGFATTLIIGICTSLFAAIFLSRLMFLWLLSKNKTINFSNKYTENTLVKANFPFITKRKIGYIISGTFVLITILSLSFRGLNQGVDFKGGRTFVVRFEEKLTSEQIAKALRTSFGTQPEVKQFGTDGYKITTKFMIDSNAANADSIVEAKMYEGLKPILTAGVTYEKFIADYRQSSQKVGPTIADDIKIGSVWAILGALAIMFGYIFIRFKNWQYGLGAIAALAHDAIFVIGLFSLFYSIMPFSLEIDQAFIAAILTVIGYSVNDTVIIYDRIREYLSIHKKKDRGTIMNDALNSTLTRTLNTAGTTLVTLLAIFIFGGDVIRGFVFALFTGIAIGTYSSIFISAPVVYDTIKQVEKAEEVKSRRRKAAIAAAEADTKTE